MAVVFYPDAAVRLWLRHGLNQLDPQFQTLKLYVNDVTPDRNSTDATFTEASGGGYAQKELNRASWSFSTNVNKFGEATQPLQGFSFTGPLTGNATIFGWFLVKRFSTGESTGGLLAARRLIVPFSPANNGDNIGVSLILELFSLS